MKWNCHCQGGQLSGQDGEAGSSGHLRLGAGRQRVDSTVEASDRSQRRAGPGSSRLPCRDHIHSAGPRPPQTAVVWPGSQSDVSATLPAATWKFRQAAWSPFQLQTLAIHRSDALLRSIPAMLSGPSSPYNLYCVGADVKPCSINQSTEFSEIARVHVAGVQEARRASGKVWKWYF